MNWTDEAFILDVSPMGEGSARVAVLSKEHGVYNGFVRGARSKQNVAGLTRGNFVKVEWKGRLEEHLGQFKVDLITGFGTNAILDRSKLEAINMLCAMILSCMNERQLNGPIFKATQILMNHLEDLNIFMVLYQKWELGLLSELGFGLDLAKCADTGVTENLTHVSPKTGKAVCATSAEPFKDKLLRLPNHLLVDDENLSTEDQILGFKLTGYFIEKWILTQKNKQLPTARNRFLDRLKKMNTIGQL